MPATPLITLLTDFGTEDTYVGQMKGVIAGICPDATVVDLTHAVRPQQIEQGAFLLETAVEAFPPGAIHLAVVDPGVGTDRAALALRSAHNQLFVGPDNGLLSCALPLGGRPAALQPVPVPEGVHAVTLGLPEERVVSATFHGRDVFAVAAARLALGRDLSALGTRAESIIALPSFRGRALNAGALEGRVLHIDRFGNVITSVHVSQINGLPRAVTVGATQITTVVRTYGEGSGLVALVGSSGFVEVAEVNGDAAARLDARLGQVVTVHLS